MARKKHAQPTDDKGRSLSRSVAAEYYGTKMRKRSHRRIAAAVLATIFVLLVGASVAVAAYVADINSKLTGEVDENLRTVLVTQEAGKPFYLLLIGIDKDEGRTNDPTYGKEDSGYRSDSIMLTRIDPSEKKVTMVSIHRDTLYDMGENGQQKINAAYAIGQEAYTTKVISEFANVPISHYAEVDMDGLAAVIDVIGGIDIELDMDISDPYYTGIDLKAGPNHLDGHTAALFCRCRHAYDALGDGDRYRAANQRLVISTVAKKVLASDPATIASTVSTMATHVRTDLDVQSIVSLAMQFIGMDTENDIYTGMEPTVSRIIDGIYYEIVDTTAWRKMMRRVDQGLPPTEEGDIDALETSPEPTMDNVEVGYDNWEDNPYNYDGGVDSTYYDDGGYVEGENSYDGEEYYDEG